MVSLHFNFLVMKSNVIYNHGFGLRAVIHEDVVPSMPSPEPAPLIQGVVEFETLCPINPLTGHRENPLTMLHAALSPRNERLLGQILQELPEVRAMDAPDDVKLQTLAGRLDTGTFAENDLVMKRLEKISSVLFDDKVKFPEGAPKESSGDSIEFKPNEVPAEAE